MADVTPKPKILLPLLLIAACVGLGVFIVLTQRSIVCGACDGAPVGTSLTPAAASFVENVETRVLSELGQPIEGIEQQMIMKVYPGVIAQDFTNVETRGSHNPRGVRTSADDAITPYGMGQLLENIARRAGLRLTTDADIAAILAFMSIAPGADLTDVPQPNRITLTGTQVCLPHRDVTGPQTEECMVGLQTKEGAYYALNFGLVSQELPPLKAGDQLTATGLFTPVEALSSSHWWNYPIKGIFSVTDSIIVHQ